MDAVDIIFREPVPLDIIFQRAIAFKNYLYDGIQDIIMSEGQQITWDFGIDSVFAKVSSEDNKILWVYYTNFASVRDVLCVIADYSDVVIDDGFGNIMPGDQYVEILEENPNRDLRDEYRRRSPGWAELNKKVDATAAREKQEEQEELARFRQEFEEKRQQQNQPEV